MDLLRYDASRPQWLRVSTYPPSLSHVLLELGCMGALLSGSYALDRRYQRRAFLDLPGRAIPKPRVRRRRAPSRRQLSTCASARIGYKSHVER
jgi:hypothetical protein